MEIIEKITIIILMLVTLKAIIIGSDFNFFKWIKHGKKYIKQYNKWQYKKP